MAGWCNGSAGLLLLWAHLAKFDEAGAVARGERSASGANRTTASSWRDLAAGAAWDAVDAPAGDGTLCCGLAGRVVALADAWSLLPDSFGAELDRLVERLDALEESAVDAAFPHSLLRGSLAAQLLVRLWRQPGSVAERCRRLAGLIPTPGAGAVVR